MISTTDTILSSVLINLVYPAALTTFGVIGNSYILGGQIEGLKDGLGAQIHEMKGDLSSIRGDLRDMRDDIKDLSRRQTDFRHCMAQLEKLAIECCKDR